MKEAFVGFDSAWAGKTHGAITYAVFQGGVLEKVRLPQLADFPDATRIITKLQQECDDVLVAIDQPIIVPNPKDNRPVDLIAHSFMVRLRSAAQFANRTRNPNIFGDDAPVWKFITRIGPSGYSGRTNDSDDNRAFVDFEAAKIVTGQTHLIEVYPALALPALECEFMNRGRAAKYNPDRDTFSLDDWYLVCRTIKSCAEEMYLQQLWEWSSEMANPWDSPLKPQKPHQDKIDAALCLIIAMQLRRHRARYRVMAVGHLDSGYMITPTSHRTRRILQEASHKNGIHTRFDDAPQTD